MMLTVMASRAPEKGVDPTIARDARSNVKRGESIDLVLEAIPNFGNVVTFEIQSPPLHGTLSQPLQLTDHSARITYRHDGSKDPKADRFTFRAATAGRAKSSPATVSLVIVPPAACLEYNPPILDFGEVFLSEKKRAKVTIFNTGGVPAKGRLILPVGFTASDGDTVVLGEHQSSVVTVEFSPMEEKQFSETVAFPSLAQKSPLLLKGVGRSRFHAAKTGAASCELENVSSSPIVISFSGGEGWVVPQIEQLPAGSRKTISFQPLRSEESVAAPAKPSRLHLSDGLSTVDLELPAPDSLVPVTVERLSPESLGSVPSGSTQKIAFRLSNRTGDPKKVRWSVASGSGGGSTMPKDVELAAGESREIGFDWRPSGGGKATLTLSVEEGSRIQDMTWRAMITDPLDKNPDLPIYGKESSESSSEERPATEQPEAASFPAVAGAAWEIETRWFGPPRVLMSWPLGGKDTGTMELDENHAVISSSALEGYEPSGDHPMPSLRMESTHIQAVKKFIRGRREVAMLPPLGAGWHLILLSKVLPSGLTEEFSQFQIEVPSTPSWWGRMRWPLGILLLVSLGVLLIRSKGRNR